MQYFSSVILFLSFQFLFPNFQLFIYLYITIYLYAYFRTNYHVSLTYDSISLSIFSPISFLKLYTNLFPHISLLWSFLFGLFHYYLSSLSFPRPTNSLVGVRVDEEGEFISICSLVLSNRSVLTVKAPYKLPLTHRRPYLSLFLRVYINSYTSSHIHA